MATDSQTKYMRMALEQAALAYDKGEVPVGAILLCDDGQIFATHNTKEGSKLACAHAEILAINSANESEGSWRLPKSTLFVTLEPCLMCAGAIIQARIPHVVFGALDLKAGAISSLYNIFDDKRLNHNPTFIGGILADECSELLKRFFQSRRK